MENSNSIYGRDLAVTNSSRLTALVGQAYIRVWSVMWTAWNLPHWIHPSCYYHTAEDDINMDIFWLWKIFAICWVRSKWMEKFDLRPQIFLIVWCKLYCSMLGSQSRIMSSILICGHLTWIVTIVTLFIAGIYSSSYLFDYQLAWENINKWIKCGINCVSIVK